MESPPHRGLCPPTVSSLAAAAEIFVSLSPRVQCRHPDFVFIDIESTAGLLGGELGTLKKALALASSLEKGPVLAAIADRPPVAQALLAQAQHSPLLVLPQRPLPVASLISPPGEDAKTLGQFPLSALLHLEGLHPWPRIRLLEHIVDFFKSLGVHSLKDIIGFPLAHFRERWGEIGVQLWKRLHGQEEQIISPLIPDLPFTAYRYFENPIGLSDFLLREIHPSLEILLLRLEGLGRFARRMDLTLHCEYSKYRHEISIEPVSPNRNQKLFEDLLLQKLDSLDLENPIRELEIHLFDVPEKIQQMDFFEPRDTSEERWQRLISFAKQADLKMGFLEPLPRHFPEESFHLKEDWPEILSPQDLIERQDDAIQIKSIYAKNLMASPRPTLLLKDPLPLTRSQLRRYRRMTFFPSERIQASWWDSLNPEIQASQRLGRYRDYYFALSAQGELVWIYQDRETKDYFLHGYFD